MTEKAESRISLHQAMQQEKPLVVVGTINAYCAILARDAGFKALYLSGAGVANASFGLPDLGLTTLTNVLEEAARITARVELPLIVDADTGFGDPSKCCKALENVGVAAMQIEDQEARKRCGHRDGKTLVSTELMVDRIKSALDGRTKSDFSIIARTDAYANEGLDRAIERSQAYIEAGADIIFAEALIQIEDYQRFSTELSKPVLANITEFGKTSLYSVTELAAANISLVLYPLTVFRAMNAVATESYRVLREQGSQVSLLDTLQSRAELYQTLDYLKYEKEQDEDLSSE
ncbi:MAG: methylisocitrate lyase [Thiohalomonadales bacterium]